MNFPWIHFTLVLLALGLSGVCGHAHQPRESYIESDKQFGFNDDMDYRLYNEGQAINQLPERRGWAWLSNVFQVVKITGQVASATSSLANIGNTIFRFIAGCCVDFPDACTSRDVFLEMQAKINEKSKQIDDMQLEVQNIQVWTNHTINVYEDIVRELNKISDEQERYINSFSNDVNDTLKNATKDIEDVLKANITVNPDKPIEFIDVTKLFESVLDKSMSFTVPMMGLLIPFGENLYKYAKRVVAAKGAGAVEKALAAVLKTAVALRTKQTESKLSRFISETNRLMAIEAVKIKNHLNKRFGKAIKIASAIGKGLSVSMNYLNTAMNIYMIISSHKACKKRQEQVQQAEKEMKQAMEHLEDTEVKIKEAKQVLEKSFEYLRSNITNSNLKALLSNIKLMVEEISSPSQELIEVAVGIETFLSKIDSETSYRSTYQLQQTLLQALAQVPSTLRCYTNKVKMANYVFTSCKSGYATFDVIYKDAQELFDVDTGYLRDVPQTCMRKLGFRYIDKEDIFKAWKGIADKDGWNPNCLLNKPDRQYQVCRLARDGYSHDQIAEKLSLSKEEVSRVVNKCPKVQELTPTVKRSVCNLRNLGISNEKIAEFLKIDLQLVEDVTCDEL